LDMDPLVIIHGISIIVMTIVGTLTILGLIAYYDSISIADEEISKAVEEKMNSNTERKSGLFEDYFDIMRVVDENDSIPQSVFRRKTRSNLHRSQIEKLETPLRRSTRSRRPPESLRKIYWTPAE